jgi:hypothetical protein
MANSSFALISTMTPTFTALMQIQEPKSELVNVEPILYLMLKLETIMYLQLLPKGEFGSLRKLAVASIRTKGFLTVIKWRRWLQLPTIRMPKNFTQEQQKDKFTLGMVTNALKLKSFMKVP